MYKLLDLFLALRNQFCLTYTSAKSLCSDSEWSDHPRQKWVTSGEKSKKYGFLSHSRIPRSPLQACKLTWHLSQLKKKNAAKDLLKHQVLISFITECDPFYSLFLGNAWSTVCPQSVAVTIRAGDWLCRVRPRPDWAHDVVLWHKKCLWLGNSRITRETQAHVFTDIYRYITVNHGISSQPIAQSFKGFLKPDKYLGHLACSSTRLQIILIQISLGAMLRQPAWRESTPHSSRFHRAMASLRREDEEGHAVVLYKGCKIIKTHLFLSLSEL